MKPSRWDASVFDEINGARYMTVRTGIEAKSPSNGDPCKTPTLGSSGPRPQVWFEPQKPRRALPDNQARPTKGHDIRDQPDVTTRISARINKKSVISKTDNFYFYGIVLRVKLSYCIKMGLII